MHRCINTTLEEFIVCMRKIIVGKGKFYVYILKWVAMSYVGSKTAKNSNHEKLFVDGGYFTSSKYVKKYLNEFGLPENIKIILFETAEEAYAYETRYLNRVDARNNSKFLNKHNNDFKYCGYCLDGYVNPRLGKKTDKESLDKMKKSRYEMYDGKYSSGSYNLSQSGKEILSDNMKLNNPMKNPEIAKIVGRKISENSKTWEHWYKFRFLKYFDNHEIIEEYIINNIDSITKFDLIKIFNIERRKAKQVLDRFKGKYYDCYS